MPSLPPHTGQTDPPASLRGKVEWLLTERMGWSKEAAESVAHLYVLGRGAGSEFGLWLVERAQREADGR